MNGRPDNKRLSALLDDELAANERAVLEQELATSPELQRELDELRRVAASVRELPQVPAPSDLQPAVMAAIQQEVRPGNDRPTGSGRVGGRPGLTKLVGLSAAIAVAVGAAVWFGQDHGEQIAETHNNSPEIRSFSQDRPEALANRAEFDSSQADDEVSPDDGATVEVATGLRVLQISRDDLTAARVGDIVEAVDANGDSVGVIRLTVVDRRDSLQALQVLLTSQQFKTLASDSSPDADQSGLVAVYVESDREKLSQAISEFRSHLDFGSLEVTSPVRVTELEAETRSELGIDEKPSTEASQRTVALKPGSQLDRLAQAPTVDSAKPAPSESTDEPSGNAPVRVIFLVVDGPAANSDGKASPKENGAA
ncbi:MAG: anti-sigma factor family protein [Planctomycetota bacterium]|jgi:anti-sigma factor RsiW